MYIRYEDYNNRKQVPSILKNCFLPMYYDDVENLLSIMIFICIFSFI